VSFIDLTVRDLDSAGGELEQFADITQNLPTSGSITIDKNFLDNTLYPLCAQAKYRDLPEPFNMKDVPKVPYSMQITIVPSYLPPGKDREYVDMFKHIYLHRNKVLSTDCISYCQGSLVRFDWGKQPRMALSALNYLPDRVAGMQVRFGLCRPNLRRNKPWTNQTERLAIASSRPSV